MLNGFHAFTGDDYISSFFRKGKALCWKVVEKNQRFLQESKSTWNGMELGQVVFEVLEEYVRNLYVARKRKVNSVRQMFQRKYENEEKIVDL